MAATVCLGRRPTFRPLVTPPTKRLVILLLVCLIRSVLAAGYAVLRRNLGDPEKTKESFEEISPLRHVDQIRIPVFVAHGKDDPVVNVAQSRALVRELERHHVPCETMFAAEEGHGMLHLNHQVELYNRVLAFLNHYLGPGLKAPATPGTK